MRSVLAVRPPSLVYLYIANRTVTRTPILGGMGNDPAVEAELKKRQPLGGVGDPEDIARCAVALASDDARFMTGICLPVDGGYTVQ